MRRTYGSEKRGLYRARDGMIFGVCKGMAEYLDFSVFWTRIIAVGVFFLSGFWPIVALYLVAALLMKPEPVLPLESDDEREFYNSYVSSRPMALNRVKQAFDRIERRIRRMEDIVTAREYDWDRRLGK